VIYSNKKQQLFEKSSEIKVAILQKFRMIFITNGSHHMSATKLMPFVVSKDEYDTEEGTGKSMNNTLHVQWYGKRYLSG